jgi:hypothetical protein
MAASLARKSIEGEQLSLDIPATGYQAAREAFQRALRACEAKLTAADRAAAVGILGLDAFTAMDDDIVLPFADTCLYSRPGDPFVRGRARRPVDRIVPKLKLKGDPLAAAIAERLPHAFFSVFEIVDADPSGRVTVKDLIDGGRRLEIMDIALANSTERGVTFAGRFVDLGPWHVGFGVVEVLRKSEAAAIVIAVSHSGDLAEKRDALHELVYSCRIHDEDLVMHALEPMILALSMAIDMSDVGVEEFVSQFASALTEADVE